MSEYASFLESKRQLADAGGFEPVSLPDFLFPFQRALTEWAIRQGRAGLFADCGLGKTPMELVWAENVLRKTNKPVLILTPLAVAYQTVREAEKFGIEAEQVEGILRLERPRAHEFIPQLVEQLPGLIESVSVGRPTLEDVFIHVTGHRFREGDDAV